MKKLNKEELHEEAYAILENAGLKTGAKLRVRQCFIAQNVDEYPFTSYDYKNKYYHSEIEDLNSLGFETEKEVILVNAMYENVKENFNMNDFIPMIKFTFRLLNIDSNWSK